MACVISVPWPGIKPASSAVEAWSLTTTGLPGDSSGLLLRVYGEMVMTKDFQTSVFQQNLMSPRAVRSIPQRCSPSRCHVWGLEDIWKGQSKYNKTSRQSWGWEREMKATVSFPGLPNMSQAPAEIGHAPSNLRRQRSLQVWWVALCLTPLTSVQSSVNTDWGE